MTSTQTFIASGAIAAALVFLGMALLFKPIAPATGSTIYLGPHLPSVATTSARAAITTSARVLATTTSLTGTSYTRLYASICTTSNNPVAILLDGDKPANASTAGVTAWIAAAAGYDACYVINDQNPYSGSVTASSTNQTSTVINYVEYVQ